MSCPALSHLTAAGISSAEKKNPDFMLRTLHDLRHSYASVAASGGQSLVIIGKMLGHSQPATTARYAHLADDPVRAASEAVGRYIASALDGNNGEVVGLSREARRKLHNALGRRS